MSRFDWQPGWHSDHQLLPDNALLVAFSGDRLLRPAGDQPWRPFSAAEWQDWPSPEHPIYLGEVQGAPCYAAHFSKPPLAALATIGLREVLFRQSDPEFALAGFAQQLLQWHRTTQYCGRCGSETSFASRDRAKQCGACDHTTYPLVSPCIIVVVHKGDSLLLGRSAHYPEGMYSTLAGFIEPGESAEQALMREVKEESGVVVGNIRYMESQPWPFPHQLMLGYRAEYQTGEVACEDDELEDVRWFRHDQLPSLPPRQTIARRLIDGMVQAIQANNR